MRVRFHRRHAEAEHDVALQTLTSGTTDSPKRQSIKTAVLAVVRLLLDADVIKEDLASLQFIISATGPLEPQTRDEIEARYDIPVV
jgi:long-chain acyl-CoA synthetase